MKGLMERGPPAAGTQPSTLRWPAGRLPLRASQGLHSAAVEPLLHVQVVKIQVDTFCVIEPGGCGNSAVNLPSKSQNHFKVSRRHGLQPKPARVGLAQLTELLYL